MPLRSKDAKLEFYTPAGSLRYTLTTNIRRIEIREISRDEADDAGFDLAHDFANLDNFVIGDEVRVHVKTENDSDFVHIWTGTVDSFDPARTGPDFANLPLKAQDWVFYTLATTYITDAWESMSAGAILASAIASAAPAINTANVQDTLTTIKSFIARDESLLSVARRLAEIANAEWKGDKDKKLYFFEKKTQSSGLSVDTTKVVRGTFHVEHTLAGFGNSVLVRGGVRQVQDQDNNVAPVSYSTVTGTTRKKVRVFASKSKVGRVDIYTNPDSPSSLTGELLVRIQADNEAGTAPVDEGNSDADLAIKSLPAAFLADADYTTFNLPDHIAPPGGFIWLIVESTDAGQRVAVDASGGLVYKTFYDVPIIVRREDAASITSYGKRELPPVTDKSITNEDDATRMGDAIVAAHKTPPKAGVYEVSDMSLSAAPIGQTLSVSFPKDGVANSTTVVLLEKQHVYDAEAGTYSLKHAFTDAERALRASDLVRLLSSRIKRLEDTVWGAGLISLLGTIAETAVIADTLTGTSADTGTAVVGTAKVGFSTVA